MSGLDITPRLPAGRQVVQRYGNGGFRIGGHSYTGSLIVFPERVVAWPVRHHEEIDEASLGPIVGGPETVGILLVGCGRRFETPPFAVIRALRRHGVVLEWMDTGAACRTFNVLVAEDRQVAAALVAGD